MNSKEIIDVSHHECNPSSQHPLGPCLVPVSWKSAGASSFVHPGMAMDLSVLMLPLSSITHPPEFVTSSLLWRPHDRIHISVSCRIVIQNFAKGKGLGLMVSFANMAESIKNMCIQDEAQVFEDKMNSLSELEENGFEVGCPESPSRKPASYKESSDGSQGQEGKFG